MVDSTTRTFVRERAHHRCEYCCLPQEDARLAQCNLRKGPNLPGIDPFTKQVTRLYHPRLDTWEDHFEFQGVMVMGLTAVGRATVQVLALNNRRRLELRALANPLE